MPLLPEDYGLASLERFSRSQIWDVFYYPSWQERGSRQLSETYAEESAVAVRHHIKRQCAMLHIGEGTADPARDRLIRENPQPIRDLLERHRDRLLGVARCTVGDVNRALGVIDEWIVRGPMVGVCFPSIGPGALECNDPKFDPIVRRLTEAGAIIVQLCNFVAGKKDSPDYSTPIKLAELAARHPKASFVCGHAGGDWEKGIRAVRAYPNIFIETSGFDPTAGVIEMAVRELGVERVLFGSHLPGRSMGTELSKVLGAAISDREKELIFSGNLRRLLAPILRRKGLAE